MSLSSVLSTMRALILDDVSLPEDLTQRTEFIRNNFTQLSETELEDLAKIPAEKFKTYTSLVFAGERSTLRNHFRVTFVLLKKIYKDRFDSLSLVKKLHKKYPWQGNTTLYLAESFVRFLREDIDIEESELKSLLIECSEMELSNLKIARGFQLQNKDIRESKEKFLSLEELVQFDVEQLMQQQVYILENVIGLKTHFDLLAIRQLARDEILADSFQPLAVDSLSSQCLLGGRDTENDVMWTAVSQSVYDLCIAAQASSKSPNLAQTSSAMLFVEDLAFAFLQEPEVVSLDEVRQFELFFAVLHQLINRGILCLIKQNEQYQACSTKVCSSEGYV